MKYLFVIIVLFSMVSPAKAEIYATCPKINGTFRIEGSSTTLLIHSGLEGSNAIYKLGDNVIQADGVVRFLKGKEFERGIKYVANCTQNGFVEKRYSGGDLVVSRFSVIDDQGNMEINVSRNGELVEASSFIKVAPLSKELKRVARPAQSSIDLLAPEASMGAE